MLPIVLLSLNIQAQTADEIIEKYITAIGGKEKWKQVKSMKVNGFIEVQGIKINFTQQAIHNVGVRVDAEFQGQKIIDITTPTKGWSQNPFGGRSSLQPISEEELKQKLDELDIQDEFIDYASKGSTVEFLGKDEEDGNEFYKVKMTTKNNNESVYFFDVNTSLIYKEEKTVKQQGQEMKMVTKVFDYKTIPFGIKIPHKSEQMGQILVTDKIEINTTIDENIFKGN
ncbi:hypothetical protein LBMAG23_16260 [Bacteroidota bacterium]|nr:hypothetical protein LBMAG23_16260 [Bacteroidota bacterium]